MKAGCNLVLHCTHHKCTFNWPLGSTMIKYNLYQEFFQFLKLYHDVSFLVRFTREAPNPPDSPRMKELCKKQAEKVLLNNFY